MHAAFLARELEIREVVVPLYPGAFSAWGMLETEIRKDFARAYYTPISALDRADLAGTLVGQEQEAYAALGEEGISRDAGRVEHAVDIRYTGQEYTLTIPLDATDEPNREGFGETIAGRFDDAYLVRFGHANPGAPIEFVTVRSTALGDLGRILPERAEPVPNAEYSSETRPAVFDRRERDTTFVRRDDLVSGAAVSGPAVVVEETATTVVPPSASLEVDQYGALVITVGEEE